MVRVFLTGGAGYMGRALIPLLARRGHSVTALVRTGSEPKLPAGCDYVIGDALDAVTYAARVPDCDTLVHLIGVPRPSPWKAQQFHEVDLVLVSASVATAQSRNVRHFVYLSIAQPAPVMRAYQQVRAECEQCIRDAGLNASILRPWYVLGQGHRWPLILVPAYECFELMKTTREAATRLGLITLDQMVSALVWAVETPPAGVRVTGVAEMRRIPRLSPPSPDTTTPGRSATPG